MKLRKILKQLVKDNIKYQEEHQDLKSIVSEKNWLNEACTVKLGTNRQAGHTTSAIYLSKYYNKILYISTLKNNLKNLKISDDTSINLCNYNYLTSDSIRGTDYDIVIIDPVSLLSSKQLESIKDMCAPLSKYKNFVLVLLQ